MYGESRLVTTVKSSISGYVQETRLKSTVDGEDAELELRFILGPKGEIEFLHVQCLSEVSPWRGSIGLPLEQFYDITHGRGSQIITCKLCGRKWKAWLH